MPFDLAANRTFIRFLISDPNGDAISDAVLRDTWLNPTLVDWWQRFERRPAAQLDSQIALFSMFDKTAVSTSLSIDTSATLEAFFVQPQTSGGTLILGRGDFNRIRYNQETEGRTGIPTEIGLSFIYNDASQPGLLTLLLACYPIPSEDCRILAYGAGKVTLLAADATAAPVAPTSAYYVSRLCAYRIATALELPQQRIGAIVAGLPEWVTTAYNIDRKLSLPDAPIDAMPLYREAGPNA